MAHIDNMDVSKETALLTISEAAEFLHVHANTLRRWSDVGLLASYRICDRGDRRFFKEDLVRFLNDYNAYKDNTQIKGRSTEKILNLLREEAETVNVEYIGKARDNE